MDRFLVGVSCDSFNIVRLIRQLSFLTKNLPRKRTTRIFPSRCETINVRSVLKVLNDDVNGFFLVTIDKQINSMERFPFFTRWSSMMLLYANTKGRRDDDYDSSRIIYCPRNNRSLFVQTTCSSSGERKKINA